MSATLAAHIDALLPQTQCTRCGYEDCAAYARALASNEADINQCPPGGENTLHALAELLHKPVKPIDPARGGQPTQPIVARIVEADCIGCYKCVAACPVDAIVGAPKRMHTVLEADCSGCELCVPVCPTDCIVLEARAADWPAPSQLADEWRLRHQSRSERLLRERERRGRPRTQPAAPALQVQAQALDVAAAIARARARRQTSS